MTPATGRPRAVHACCATLSLSPVTIFTRTPSRSKRASALAASALIGSVKTRKPASSRSPRSGTVARQRPGAGPGAEATPGAPRRELRVKHGGGGGSDAARAAFEHRLRRALDEQLTTAAWCFHQHGHQLAVVVERNLAQASEAADRVGPRLRKFP